jgi:hypothetical protein
MWIDDTRIHFAPTVALVPVSPYPCRVSPLTYVVLEAIRRSRGNPAPARNQLPVLGKSPAGDDNQESIQRRNSNEERVLFWAA